MLYNFCVPFLSKGVAVSAKHGLLVENYLKEMQPTRRIRDFGTY